MSGLSTIHCCQFVPCATQRPMLDARVARLLAVTAREWGFACDLTGSCARARPPEALPRSCTREGQRAFADAGADGRATHSR